MQRLELVRWSRRHWSIPLRAAVGDHRNGGMLGVHRQQRILRGVSQAVRRRRMIRGGRVGNFEI